jgi:hypothetical protein
MQIQSDQTLEWIKFIEVFWKVYKEDTIYISDQSTQS